VAAMQQSWITAPLALEVRTVPVPVPGPGEVLVSTAYAGICGSDLHTFTRGHPWLPYPIAPGHEASGLVVATGAGVSALAEGDEVYVRPAVACGSCFYCGRGRPNLCARLVGVGSHIPGFLADHAVVPQAALARVPPGVGLAAAAMIEPLATAVHAVTRAGDVRGATALVVGGGTIGQSVLLALLAAGAGAAAVVDPVAGKRELAVALGAAGALEPDRGGGRERVAELLGGRPDVVFDCVASAGSLRGAVAAAARGGVVVVVGAGHGPVELAIESIQDDETTVTGSAMYRPASFERAEELVAHGVPVRRLISSVRPMGEAAQAVAAAAAGDQMKIHLAGPAAPEARGAP
jgi:2-desacetyl-2-hydroxyethyl bacteriochlorophyllide A dehydrogenase